MSGNLRGQVSTEFFLYVTVFMFVVIGAFLVVNYLQSSEVPVQQNKVAKLSGEEFANVITLSVKGGIGFSYNYTFPKTLMGIPYKITLRPGGSNTMIMEWPGPYGNFSYSYNIPAYGYEYEGGSGCVTDGVLVSNECKNMITLSNNGSILTIIQES